jgi:hypothetical protein
MARRPEDLVSELSELGQSRKPVEIYRSTGPDPSNGPRLGPLLGQGER